MSIPVVAGVDGSVASLEAVDWAAAEAGRHQIPLRLLHAAADDGEASDVIDAASERVREASHTVRLSSELLHKDAASALVDKGRNAFAPVLGSRGLGGLAGMLLGPVGLALAARADCPVVVVRGAADHTGVRFGTVVVGVEDGESSGTAVRFVFREARVRRCRLVAASGADLLVVGARRRQGHLGLQLGLINHAVLHHAPCPVVVVPRI
ncbi:universal stress protein [Streptomyces sp. Lzd4kr]|nr:universal stress protein [Streptomyces sp. Lzd4kr]